MTDCDDPIIAEPPDLERELAKLRATIALQERTIKRQETELAMLRAAVPNGALPAPSAGAAPIAQAGQRSAFALVPGADYTIVFDGGADPNPGRGYGSYQIVATEGVVAHHQIQLGDNVTNNQAEYRTLIHALRDLRERLGRDAAHTVVAVRGDSDLLIKQVNGLWKVKNADIRPLHETVGALLREFRRVDVKWHGRANSVRVLGH